MIGLIDFSNPSFKYDYKGYTAIINQVIDISVDHFIRYGNTDLIISDEQVLDYFDPINKIEEYNYNASNVFLDNFCKNKTTHNIYNAHTLANKDDLNLRYEVLNKILLPKPFLNDEVNNLLKKFDINDKTLGVQIRGTDKKQEVPKIPDDLIIKSISQTLNDYNLNKIFLSTDDNYYLQLLKNNLKENVIYNENNLISYDGNPLHFSKNRKKTNKDVLLDIYLLSNCEHFLYCYSNVSYLALTIGSKKQKYIKNINYEN